MVGEQAFGVQRRLHLAVGSKCTLRVSKKRLLGRGSGLINASAQTPALQQGLRDITHEVPDRKIAVEQIAQRARRTARRGCETNAGQQGAPSLDQPAVGRGEAALSGYEVGASAYELGRQTGWNRTADRGQLVSNLNPGAGIASQDQFELAQGSVPLLAALGEGRFGRGQARPAQAHVER